MKAQTKTQISAGGIAYRRNGKDVEVALISVGAQRRWQLPKGLVDEGENTEEAARREVREEAGIETEFIRFIDKIEYWYYGTEQGARALSQVRTFLSPSFCLRRRSPARPRSSRGALVSDKRSA